MDAAVADDAVEPTTIAAAAVGTKRSSYERDEEKILEKRPKCNYWEDEDAVEPTPVGAKRKYDRDDVMTDQAGVIYQKRFKCNYWEDPSACPHDLQRWGSQLAQMAALDIDNVRFMQEVAAWRAEYNRQ